MSASKEISKAKLVEILLDAEILTGSQLQKSLENIAQNNNSLLKEIVNLNYISKEELNSQLVPALELQYGVSFTHLNDVEPDLDIINLFSYEILQEYQFVPLKRSGNILTFAMVEPDNILADKEIKERLRTLTNITIKKVVVLEDELNEFLLQFKPEENKQPEVIEQDTDEIISSMGIDVVETTNDDFDTADLTDSVEDAPIIQLANSVLGVAIARGISDIHIEPREKELLIRYRQDGVLSIYKRLPKKVQNALISRYKIMSELDIAERRLPQDGRIRVKIGSKFIDFRVSTLPSKFGEKIVMRILDKSNISFGLDQVITSPPALEDIRDMITRPYGIIFVTGPTGSGKTTTLYSALSERNSPDVNISTAEDPIEYDLDGITQSEVNKSIGMDFAKILRAFLRQDPDIMLVGETRDKETAKIAVEAALTGHLVFTTLHTNDAPSSIIRLKEMDIEPFLISSSIIGVIAQRLLRKVCPSCKKEYEAEDTILEYLGLEKTHKTFYKGSGCENCNNTGYKGRIGAYEIMKVNDHLRELIANDANTATLRLAAQETGMRTLFEYSIDLAKEGLTTLDEVIRVTFSNDGVASFCSRCGKPVGDEFFKCPFCQNDIKKVCPRCNSDIEDEWVSCAKCGFEFDVSENSLQCETCNGEVSKNMAQCPWCFSSIEK